MGEIKTLSYVVKLAYFTILGEVLARFLEILARFLEILARYLEILARYLEIWILHYIGRDIGEIFFQFHY